MEFFFHYSDGTWKFPCMIICKVHVLISCGGSTQDVLYHTSSFAQQEGRKKKKEVYGAV